MRAAVLHGVTLTVFLCAGHANADDPSRKAPSPSTEDEREVMAHRYVHHRHMNWGALITGAIMIAGPYLLGVPSAFGNHFHGGSAWMLVPIAGPFAGSLVVNHEYQCSFSPPPSPADSDCNSPLFQQLLWFDSTVQLVGAGLLAWGLIGHGEWVETDVAAWLAPAVLPGGGMLRLNGFF